MKSILVADDHSLVRKALVNHLSRQGFHLLDVSSGKALLELVRAEKPTIDICDLETPVVTCFGKNDLKALINNDLDTEIFAIYLDDYTYGEIAEKHGLTLNHVGVKIHRLKNYLKTNAEINNYLSS
jgi:response regulator RpfG family c-di-GMP phosphodiesterase